MPFPVKEVSLGVFQPLTGNPTVLSLNGEVQQNLDVLTSGATSDDERALFGIYIVQEAEVPAGFQISNTFFSKVAGQVIQTHEFQPVTQIARKIDVAEGWVTVTGTTISAVEGFGFSGATRVALGRIRFFFAEQQPDNLYNAFPSVRHATLDVFARINGASKNVNYVELKTNGIEALEYGVQVTRIIRS